MNKIINGVSISMLLFASMFAMQPDDPREMKWCRVSASKEVQEKIQQLSPKKRNEYQKLLYNATKKTDNKTVNALLTFSKKCNLSIIVVATPSSD